MHLHIFSDLHADMADTKPIEAPPGVDVVVVAGAGGGGRVARMSAATSGVSRAAGDEPGYRCAHPGYGLMRRPGRDAHAATPRRIVPTGEAGGGNVRHTPPSAGLCPP
ncbi:hypothetical protein BRADO3471 [Bradyrhizobium sp. ORS 278]|nr:hypothetical protein BRADO3471 [Bradyrhizobium sp. ORS 278]